MIAVSDVYKSKITQRVQRWIPSATVDFSDFNIDNSIAPSVYDPDRTSDEEQLSNGREISTYRWWNWDSFQWGDHLRSEEATSNEKGAMSNRLSFPDGSFPEFIGGMAGDSSVAGYTCASEMVSYPSFCITFSPRTVSSLKAVFESVLEQWAVDFDIVVTQSDGTETTFSVTENTTWRYTAGVSPILNAVGVCVIVKSWSKGDAKAKVLETFTSIQKAFSGDEIISFNVVEETEAKKTSSPIGNVTANSLNISFLNRNSEFDNDNSTSVLAGSVIENRRVKPFSKLSGADDVLPFGEFYTKAWIVNNERQIASARCEDVLSLMGDKEYTESQFITEPAYQVFTYTTTSDFNTWTGDNVDTADDKITPGDAVIYSSNPQPVSFAGHTLGDISSLSSWAEKTATAEFQLSMSYTAGTSIKLRFADTKQVPGGSSIEYFVNGNKVQNGSYTFAPDNNSSPQVVNVSVFFFYQGSKPVLEDLTITVEQSVTLLSIASKVLIDYDDDTGLLQRNWSIDQAYAEFAIPKAYIPIMSYLDVLRMITEAAGGRAYQDRTGQVVLESAPVETAPVKTWDNSNTFSRVKPVNQKVLFNRISVVVNALVHDESEELASVSVTIPAGNTKNYVIRTREQPIDTIDYTGLPASVTITSETQYTWGVAVSITNASASDVDFTLGVTARPYRIRGKKEITVDDTDSIRRSGVIEFSIDNPLIQSEDFAETLATNLIQRFGNQRRAVTIDALPDPSILIGDSIYIENNIYVIQSNQFRLKAGELTQITEAIR